MTNRRSHVPKTSIGYCDSVTPPYVNELATSCVSTVQNDSDDVMTQIAPKITAPLSIVIGMSATLTGVQTTSRRPEHDHDDDDAVGRAVRPDGARTLPRTAAGACRPGGAGTGRTFPP